MFFLCVTSSKEELLKTSKSSAYKILLLSWAKNTVCFAVLGKLNLTMVVRFKARANFCYCHQRPLKMTHTIKVFKIDSKIIISLPQSKSLKQTVFLNIGIDDEMANLFMVVIFPWTSKDNWFWKLCFVLKTNLHLRNCTPLYY